MRPAEKAIRRKRNIRAFYQRSRQFGFLRCALCALRSAPRSSTACISAKPSGAGLGLRGTSVPPLKSAPRKQLHTIADLAAPVSAVIASAVISRSEPAGAGERGMSPVTGMPGVAGSRGIPIASHPGVAQTGRRWNISGQGRGRRRVHDHRRWDAVPETGSHPDAHLSQQAARCQQCQNDQSGFHISSFVWPFSKRPSRLYKARSLPARNLLINKEKVDWQAVAMHRSGGFGPGSGFTWTQALKYSTTSGRVW